MYTIALLFLIALGAAGLAVRHLVFQMREEHSVSEKRRTLFIFLGGLGKFLVVIFGLAGFVYAVLADAKSVAFIVALLALFLYGMLAYGTKKNNPV
jgi:hypothetical protein